MRPCAYFASSSTASARQWRCCISARSTPTSTTTTMRDSWSSRRFPSRAKIGYAEVQGEAELTLGQVELKRNNIEGANREIRPLAGSLSRSGRQARSGRHDVVARESRPSAWRHRSRARAPGRSVARIPRFRDERRNGRLPRGLRRTRSTLCSRVVSDSAASFLGAAASLRERLWLPRSRRNDDHWAGLVARAGARLPVTRLSIRRSRTAGTGRQEMRSSMR